MNNVVQTDSPLKFKVKMITSKITDSWKLLTILFSEKYAFAWSNIIMKKKKYILLLTFQIFSGCTHGNNHSKIDLTIIPEGL